MEVLILLRLVQGGKKSESQKRPTLFLSGVMLHKSKQPQSQEQHGLLLSAAPGFEFLLCGLKYADKSVQFCVTKVPQNDDETL